MSPRELTARSFDQYPPQARAFAAANLPVLRQLPLPILVSFLERMIGWDWRFPAERDQLAGELRTIEELSFEKLQQLTRPFLKIVLPPEMSRLDWVNTPATFLDRFTAYLWSSQQIDAYRAAARVFIDELSAQTPPVSAKKQRLVVVTCTEDLVAEKYSLFLKLRRYGLLATNVQSSGAGEWITEMLSRRSARDPSPYAHWLVDGGLTPGFDLLNGGPAYLSYVRAEPVRSSVLKIMANAVRSGWGPELLRLRLTELTPADCNAETITSDPVLQHFIVSLFADGSGTQIYSTSFVQWSAREILRRAQPHTLVVRIAARMRQRSLNGFVTGTSVAQDLDRAGSLVDGDLAAYYTWLELQKLAGAENSVFLAWFAGPKQALLAGPGVPKNVDTPNPLTLHELMAFAHLDA